MAAFDEALQALYQVPLTQFIAERKRLAAGLKAAGHTTFAQNLGGRPRPPASVWAVNQLYWHARAEFDAMLAIASRIREGDIAAGRELRDTITKLRTRAATMLADARHAANSATLHRISTTLAALAAIGGFDPDPPGALQADRDPPGFEAMSGDS